MSDMKLYNKLKLCWYYWAIDIFVFAAWNSLGFFDFLSLLDLRAQSEIDLS